MEPHITIEGVLVDVLVGILTTFVGIVVLYWIVRPRFRLSDAITYTVRSDGRRRYRFGYRSRGLLRAIDLRIHASLVVVRDGQAVRMPIPLTTEDRLIVPKRMQAPRLMVERIPWATYLPEVDTPGPDADLEQVMRDLDARLMVELIAASEVFQVNAVYSRVFRVEDVRERRPDDLRQDQRLP